MYFISILAIILVTIILGNGWGFSPFFGLTSFIDLPSLLIILLICIPLLISSGLFKDFNNAFRIALNKKAEYSLIEIKRAIEAVSLTIKTLLCAGIFLFTASLLQILKILSDPVELGPTIAVSLLTLIYTLIFALMLLPIKSILNIRIIEFMPELTENTENISSEESE